MICNKCGIDGNFTWDRQHNENTGQWRLFDLNMERPHECSGMKTEEAILNRGRTIRKVSGQSRPTCKMPKM